MVKDAHLEVYLSYLEDTLMNINENGYNYPNLPIDEREALESLRNDTDIIIKPADKGSAIVIWGKADYLLEAELQLGDTDVYEKVTPTVDINASIKNKLQYMLKKKEVDKKLINFLLLKR